MQDDDVYIAPDERLEADPVDLPPPTITSIPISAPAISLEDVIAGLRGFGIEENEEILTFTTRGGKSVRLRITNMPTDEEIKSLIAAEEMKGYAWVQRIRVEILSRSISWLDGFNIRKLEGPDRLVTDTDGKRRDIQVVLRNLLMGWGQELVTTLWKIAMVHSDKIERRYKAEFPDSIIETEAERRFMETILKEIEDSGKEVINDTIKQVFEEDTN